MEYGGLCTILTQFNELAASMRYLVSYVYETQSNVISMVALSTEIKLGGVARPVTSAGPQVRPRKLSKQLPYSSGSFEEGYSKLPFVFVLHIASASARRFAIGSWRYQPNGHDGSGSTPESTHVSFIAEDFLLVLVTEDFPPRPTERTRESSRARRREHLQVHAALRTGGEQSEWNGNDNLCHATALPTRIVCSSHMHCSSLILIHSSSYTFMCGLSFPANVWTTWTNRKTLLLQWISNTESPRTRSSSRRDL